jgi:hypothetical protein
MDEIKVKELRAKLKKLAETRKSIETQKVDFQKAYDALMESKVQKDYKQARTVMDSLDETAANLEKECREMASSLYDPETKTKKIPGVSGVTITENYSFRITDPKAALEWAEANMKDAIIPASLNERALGSAVRKLDVTWGEKKVTYSARLNDVEQYLNEGEVPPTPDAPEEEIPF